MSNKLANGWNKLAMDKNNVNKKQLPVMRSANMNPMNAPNHPPGLFNDLNLRNKPSRTAFADQNIERNESGRPKIPASANNAMIIPTIRNDVALSLKDIFEY